MKIFFIDTAHPSLAKLLSEAGHICTAGHQLSREEILRNIKNFDGIIIRSRIDIDKDFLNRALNLKFIGRVGAGMESIDVPYAESKGITCFNSPEGNRDAVAEHALGMLLMLFNNLKRADQQVRMGEWIREGNRGTELMGKTVGIIGYGNMGSAFAKRLQGFGVTVLVYDKYNPPMADRNQFVKESSMEELFSQSDILSIHIPLTSETKFMINDKFINSFKKNIYIINTSRGKCLKTDDLVKNLKPGKVLGACLDVNEYEETSFEVQAGAVKSDSWNYLINSDKVILTPHIAGWSFESSEKMARILAGKIIEKFG